MQGAIRSPETEEFGEALSVKLHEIWVAPSELSVGNPKKWWNLIATSSLSYRASEVARNKLFAEPGEIWIFALDDLRELGADQLHVGQHDQESNCPWGQPRRAAKVSRGAENFMVMGDPSIFAS